MQRPKIHQILFLSQSKFMKAAYTPTRRERDTHMICLVSKPSGHDSAVTPAVKHDQSQDGQSQGHHDQIDRDQAAWFRYLVLSFPHTDSHAPMFTNMPGSGLRLEASMIGLSSASSLKKSCKLASEAGSPAQRSEQGKERKSDPIRSNFALCLFSRRPTGCSAP